MEEFFLDGGTAVTAEQVEHQQSDHDDDADDESPPQTLGERERKKKKKKKWRLPWRRETNVRGEDSDSSCEEDTIHTIDTMRSLSESTPLKGFIDNNNVSNNMSWNDISNNMPFSVGSDTDGDADGQGIKHIASLVKLRGMSSIPGGGAIAKNLSEEGEMGGVFNQVCNEDYNGGRHEVGATTAGDGGNGGGSFVTSNGKSSAFMSGFSASGGTGYSSCQINPRQVPMGGSAGPGLKTMERNSNSRAADGEVGTNFAAPCLNIKNFLQDVSKLTTQFWLLATTHALFLVVFHLFPNISAHYLSLKYSMTAAKAGYLSSLLSAFTVVGAPLVGVVIDRVGGQLYLVFAGGGLATVAYCLITFTAEFR